MEGILHSFESLAAVDGDGLRCSAFLAGCPLRCAFCHNPDTWTMEGRRISPEELVKKILRFRPYFGENGGVTFSGGEPLLQAEFLCEAATLLREEKIPYILDTSGHVDLTDDVIFLFENAQSVLLDLKFWDDSSYRKYTGKGIEKTLEVLKKLNELGTKTVVRTVVIPDLNDTEKHIKAYAEVLRGFSCVTKFELLAFHTMGFYKYEKLGIENPFASKSSLPKERLEELKRVAEQIKNG